MEMEDMHCFSFVMVYGLSSNKVLYSTSDQFLYGSPFWTRFDMYS